VNILKNKHILTAVLVAPVLAILAYFAIDFMVSEPAQVAEAGQSYLLVEKPNCRYNSGNCELKNGNFELELRAESLDDNRLLLLLKSVFPLEGVKVALAENEADERRPMDMRPMGSDGLVWSLDMARPDPERHRLHLVAASGKSLYYGDVATKFTLPPQLQY